MDARIQELVNRFNNGETSEAEEKEIEKLIETGIISLTDLSFLDHLQDQIAAIESPAPSLALDDKFHTMLSEHRKSETTVSRWKNFFSLPDLMPRFAIGAVMLMIGVTAGIFFRPATSDGNELGKLRDEVTEMKEMMMFSLLEKESATERLKAVNLTQEMDGASQKVTSALLQTLNEDDNVNVRLAALEALTPYVKDSHIRQELIRSIARQKSPLVQVALAELMVQLQEKSSVKELEKILKNENTPRDIRNKIKQSIEVLI